MTTKVYELARFNAMVLTLNYCGQTIKAHFKNGVSARVRARLTTADRFIQDALEADPRFGTLYTMVRKYEENNANVARAAAVDSKPKKVANVKTVNEALLYFTKLGASVNADTDLTPLMEKYNVEFPNLKK